VLFYFYYKTILGESKMTLEITTIKKILGDRNNIEFIKENLLITPDHTTTSLARLICLKYSFFSPNGTMQLETCKSALKSLDSKGLIKLPKLKKSGVRKFTSMVRLNEKIPLPEKVPEDINELRKNLKFVLIGANDSYLKKVWNELIATEHPLGDKRVVGSQIKYLITYNDCYIGACSFSASALSLASRDKWINWSKSEQEKYHHHVLNMSRFLIRDGVLCKNLASHLLSQSTKKVKNDFEERYNITPWLVETFVDTEKYDGTCYKAANWIYIGQTKGRGRNDRNTKKDKSIKDIYIYVLDKNFRKISGITAPPERYAPLGIDKGLGISEWAEQEFGDIDLGDQRLSDRLVKVACDKSKAPSASYAASVNGDRYALKGYYNFLGNNNDEFSFNQILSRHREITIRRMNDQKNVIAIQDTTDLNYSGLDKTEGLGFIGKNKNSNGSLGLRLHSTFVVNQNGLPLGISYAECYAPEIKNRNGRNRINTPIEEKDSYRWLTSFRNTLEIAKKNNIKITSVMDREADIFELFEEADQFRNIAPIVVRAQHNRKLKNTNLKLFDYLYESTANLFNS
jgi:hypothetical protein